MFEQSSYEPSTAAEPTPEAREGDIFKNYELRTWDLSPRLYKILGVSALTNIVALLIFAQTSLLTMKGCDSPLVGSVCQALDTVYIGSLLFGTQREYVDQDYEKTELAEADITYVDLTNVDTEKLYYPSDYLKYSDPDRYAAEQAALLNPTHQPTTDGASTSGFPNFTGSQPMATPIPGNNMFNTKPVYPKRSKRSVIDGDLPPGFNDTTASNANPGTGTKTPKNDKSTITNTGTDATASGDKSNPNPPVKTTDTVDAVTINREPLKVFGKGVAEKLDKKEVDLNTNFKVVAEAVLTPDGKLDTSIDKKTKLNKSRILTAEGDPKMVAVVTDAIAAIGDSGWLGYLRVIGIEKINFTFSQTDDQLVVNITSEQLTPERANTLSSQLRGVLQTATLADKMGVKKLGDDEKALLGAATAVSDGKKVVLNFVLAKPTAQEMIQRNIQKAREAETGVKSNGQFTETAPDNRRAN